jgi:hypothetical protein
MHEDLTPDPGNLPPVDASLSAYLSDHLHGVLSGTAAPHWGVVRQELLYLPPPIAYTVAFMLRWFYPIVLETPAPPKTVPTAPPPPAAERVAGPPPSAYE